MKRHILLRAAALAIGMALAAPMHEAAAQPITFQTLLEEMTDLRGLAQWTEPAYTCKQFSSYDPRSTDPEALTDENWFANHDRGHHLRVEERNGEKEYVLMDAEGPGAIVRIWSANPGEAGIVRVYLDGAEEPAIEMPLNAMLGGGAFPFVAPISGMRARGWNSYLPIPYARHCKVTTSGHDYYYHVNYRTYSPDAEVATYSAAQADAARAKVERVAQALAEPAAPRWETLTFRDRRTVAPGESAVIASILQGGTMATGLLLRPEAPDIERALRGALLEVTFDRYPVPQVCAPLGDFFGSAPGISPFRALPTGMLEDGTLYANWAMPFRQSLQVELTNTTDEPISVEVGVVLEPNAWDDSTLYFHAKWRPDYSVPTRPRQDWNFVEVNGRGRYVGNLLHIVNPVTAWWGEGDEKIYVDHEAFPSHFGTGSEDYYGYAWGSNEVFTHAYHNQPRCDGPGNHGHTAVNRFHVIDNIPFTESFRFDMEVWHWEDTRVDLAAVSYWYGAPGVSDNLDTPAPETLVVPEPAPLPQPERVEGALEGEELRVVSVSGGAVQTQESTIWPWSGSAQLWWIDGAPGDVLETAFPVEEQGRYKLHAVFTMANDYGTARLHVNGAQVGEPMDFYHTEVIAAPRVTLGTFDFLPGENVLAIELLEPNPAAIPRNMIGIDYLLLEPAQP